MCVCVYLYISIHMQTTEAVHAMQQKVRDAISQGTSFSASLPFTSKGCGDEGGSMTGDVAEMSHGIHQHHLSDPLSLGKKQTGNFTANHYSHSRSGTPLSLSVSSAGNPDLDFEISQNSPRTGFDPNGLRKDPSSPSVCMCACMYICMCTCMYMCMNICIYMHIYIYVNIRIHI